MPRVEVLWWEGCPSAPRALAELREQLAALGHDPETVEVRQVLTQEQAEEEDFHGSPTVRVDGRDVQPPPAAEPAVLRCRLYRRRDGSIAPTPDPQDLRDALLGAR